MSFFSSVKKSKYYLFIKLPLLALMAVLLARMIFPHVEFVATKMIEYKLGDSTTGGEKGSFYASIMSFMGATAAMLYLLYMMLFDEMKFSTIYQGTLALGRRQIISAFLMILFAMFCFTAVHIMPVSDNTLIETLAYSGLILLMISFWYIMFAVFNLFYVNWNATSNLKKEFKEHKSDSKGKFNFF